MRQRRLSESLKEFLGGGERIFRARVQHYPPARKEANVFVGYCTNLEGKFCA